MESLKDWTSERNNTSTLRACRNVCVDRNRRQVSRYFMSLRGYYNRYCMNAEDRTLLHHDCLSGTKSTIWGAKQIVLGILNIYSEKLNKRISCEFGSVLKINNVNSGMKVCVRHFHEDDYILPSKFLLTIFCLNIIWYFECFLLEWSKECTK